MGELTISAVLRRAKELWEKRYDAFPPGTPGTAIRRAVEEIAEPVFDSAITIYYMSKVSESIVWERAIAYAEKIETELCWSCDKPLDDFWEHSGPDGHYPVRSQEESLKVSEMSLSEYHDYATEQGGIGRFGRKRE